MGDNWAAGGAAKTRQCDAARQRGKTRSASGGEKAASVDGRTEHARHREHLSSGMDERKDTRTILQVGDSLIRFRDQCHLKDCSELFGMFRPVQFSATDQSASLPGGSRMPERLKGREFLILRFRLCQ
jgi:hypothetical protein